MCNLRNPLGCQQLVRLPDAKEQSLSVLRRELPADVMKEIQQTVYIWKRWALLKQLFLSQKEELWTGVGEIWDS